MTRSPRTPEEVREFMKDVGPLPSVPDTDWYTYLENIRDKSMSAALTAFYKRLNDTVSGQLRPPHCGVGNTDIWQFSWDNHEHHFDVDVYVDGTFDWFYKNRATEAVDGTDEERDTEIAPRVVEYLLLTACRPC